MKIVFFGTPEFAADALETLVEKKVGKVVLVVTQPDRPVGRKKINTPPPVKRYAVLKDIEVLQPEKLTPDVINEILRTKADVGVMVAYGNLIPKTLIEGFPKGIVNIHPSLLPKHRGATPVASAILAGDTETGVSLMVIDEKLDHGPIIAQRKIDLKGDETTPALLETLTPLALEVLSDEFVSYLNGGIEPKTQDDAEATFCNEIDEDDARIDWASGVTMIERQVRAMHGVLPTWSMIHKWTEKVPLGVVPSSHGRVPAPIDLKFIAHRVHILKQMPNVPTGTLTVKNGELAVACTDGWLLIDEVQLSGGKPMSGAAFLNGRKELIGTLLT